jgi:myo-inositol-hexaphosphate 3-phosphohydrolase
MTTLSEKIRSTYNAYCASYRYEATISKPYLELDHDASGDEVVEIWVDINNGERSTIIGTVKSEGLRK